MSVRRGIGIWVRRPLIWVSFAYGFGIALSYFLSLDRFILLIAITGLFLFVLYLQFIHKLDFTYILILFMLIGWSRGLVFLQYEGPLYKYIDEEIYVLGEIADFPQQHEHRDIYIVKTEKISYEGREHAVSTKMRLTVYREPDRLDENTYIKNPYVRGDKIVFKGKVEKPAGKRNPKGFDYELYLKNRGIYNIMAINYNEIEPYSTSDRPKIKLLQSMAIWMDKTIDQYVIGNGGSLLKSMILGQRWEIPSDIRDSFSKTGTAHILAISGLHVGFIMAGIDFLLRRFYLRRTIIFAIQSTMLTIYCLLIGAPPSAVRATIMAIIYLGGYALNRPEDRANSLAFTAFLILFIKPGKLFDIGFQLSFAAVAGITLLYSRIRYVLYFVPRDTGDMLTVIAAAQLGVAPLIIYHYNIISPISIVANLFFVPMAGLVVQLGFILFLFALILPPLAKLIGIAISYLSFIFMEGTCILESIPLSSINIISPPVFLIICYYILLWMMSSEKPNLVNTKKVSAVVIAIAVIFMFIVSVYPVDLQVVFVDVGQGDCIYIKTPDRRHILIDGGGSPYRGHEQIFDTGKHIVLPFLLKNGVYKLDLVVASHWHDDHVGGLLTVVEELPIDNFLCYPPYEESENYKSIMQVLEERDISKLRGNIGQVYRIGKDMEFHILHPYLDIATDNENNRSLVIHARFKDTSLMFTGDIEEEIEELLLKEGNLRSHVLKTAHHGSITSSSEDWIQAVSPLFTVMQVGKNSFGHPHTDVIDRFNANDVKIYRTDEDGAVICRYGKRGWRVKTMVD